MSDKEFNLIYEPWILVMNFDGSVQEVSILELFEKSHLVKSISGELPTQDVAVMRLILAILHSVFARYDINGDFNPISNKEMAYKRWKQLWELKKFPMEIISEYLTNFEDRFYLFHEKYPFYQVAKLKVIPSTEYGAKKLNGEISESGNKPRFFSLRDDEHKNSLSFKEASRWLLYVNAFDDTSSKPKGANEDDGKFPSPGAGWLGKLGLIYGVGDNLFKTLMLNLVLTKENGEIWGEENPIWENEKVRDSQRTKIVIPNNQSELLTLQSRRVLLKRDSENVIGYYLLGGDFFDRENSFNENMTIWREDRTNKSSSKIFNPKRHDQSLQLWRDFSSIYPHEKESKRPGVVTWQLQLKRNKLIEEKFCNYAIASVKYGDKDFFVEDVFSDSITFNLDILDELGEIWVERIQNEIAYTDQIVSYLGNLAKDIRYAGGSGDKEAESSSKNVKENAYFSLDEPFREWLANIEPKRDNDSKDEICLEWRKVAKKTIIEIGKSLVEEAGSKAIVGRTIEKENNGKVIKIEYIAAKSFNRFVVNVNKH